MTAVARAATAVGNGWLWLPGLLLASALGTSVLLALAAAALLTNGVVVLLKCAFRRGRPALHEPNPLFAAAPVVSRTIDCYSFPSGHAANAFALATVLGVAAPALAPGLVLLACAISGSRLLLRQHFASDVLAGAALGVTAAAAALRVVAVGP